MFNKEAFKTTAFAITLFLAFLANFNIKTYAQEYRNNCRNYSGRYYIVDEVYKMCGVLANPYTCNRLTNLVSYDTEVACQNASIEKYGCTPQIENSIYYSLGNDLSNRIYKTNQVTLADAQSCLNSLQNNQTPTQTYCSQGVKFFQCKCSKTVLGDAGNLGLVVSWITGSETFYCYSKPVIGSLFVQYEKTKVYSPLIFIKVISNFMFYVAVLIFLMNLIRVGTFYIQSEGVPDDLKKGRTILNNTMGGMIFFILVTGLISYLINVF